MNIITLVNSSCFLIVAVVHMVSCLSFNFETKLSRFFCGLYLRLKSVDCMERTVRVSFNQRKKSGFSFLSI